VIGRGLDAVGERAAHGLARRDDRKRGALGDLDGELGRLGAHLILWHAHIGKADACCFLAADAPARVEQKLSLVLADQLGEQHRQAETRVEAELGEIRREARLGAGDAEVGRAGDAETAADGGAMHGGDDRLPGAKQTHRLLIEMVGRAAADGGRLVVPLRIVEVRAGAERLALRAQHHGADAVVLVELFHGSGDLLDQLHIEEVVRRPLHFDRADEIRALVDADVLVRCHEFLSCCFACQSKSTADQARGRSRRAELRWCRPEW
jgi:hypothetical protein